MAKITMTPGRVYFINERDYLTGETSPYVKIGIVRNEKEAQTRIKEHQTGNPREIQNADTVSDVPFVEYLETQLHYRFNEHWVTGEWFDLSKEELQTVITEAKRLKAEQSELFEAFERSEALSAIASNGKTAEPSKKAIELHTRLVDMKLESDILSARTELVKHQLIGLMGKHGAIDGIVRVLRTADADRFSKKRFEQENPEMYQAYLVEKETPVKGSFTLQGKKGLKKANEELYSAKQALAKPTYGDIDMNIKLDRSVEAAALHFEYLQHLKSSKKCEWEILKLEACLKEILGTNESIDGLCRWRREAKVTQSFDTSRFKAEKEDIYNSYMETVQGTYKLDISSHRAYPHK